MIFQEIKDLILIVFPFLSLLSNWFFYNRLNAKDRKDLDLKLLDRSYVEVEKLWFFLEAIEKEEEKKIENVKIFLHHIEHICICILSGCVSEKVVRYRYAPFIESLIQTNYLPMMLKKINLPFEKEDFLYLEDTYKLIKRRRYIKNAGFFKRFF